MFSFQDKLCENLNNVENKKLNYIRKHEHPGQKYLQNKKLHQRINIYWVQIIDKQSNQVC